MSDKIRQKDKNNISVYIQGGEKKVMTKFNKKMINVLATATLVAGVAAPIAALTAPTAIHAASSYTNLSNPSISSSAQDDATLGRTRMVITQASIAAGASFTVTLPKGFEFSGAGNGVGRVNSATDATYGLGVYLDAGDNNLAKNADSTGYNDANAVEVTKLTDNSARVQLNFSNSADDATLYLNFGKVDVTGPANGPIKVAIDAASASGLTSGEAVIGNVVSSGQISLSAADTVSSEENFTATLKVKEETAGSLGKNNIKLKLPSGFKWDSAPKSEATILFGTDIKPANVKYSADGDTLTLSLDKVSGQQTSFQLPVGFYVDDETSAKEGDVTVSISGNATTDVSSLVVGSYGQIGGGVSVATPTTILAGHDEQKNW